MQSNPRRCTEGEFEDTWETYEANVKRIASVYEAVGSY